MYVPKESGMLKIHVQNLKSRIFERVHLKVCFTRLKPVTKGLEVVRVQMAAEMRNGNCVCRTKQQMSTNDIDTTLSTPFLIYFLIYFMFIKELTFIINSSYCFSDPGGSFKIMGISLCLNHQLRTFHSSFTPHPLRIRDFWIRLQRSQ